MLPSIGILGTGFLGRMAVEIAASNTKLWATFQNPSSIGNLASQVDPIFFKWNDPNTWNNLPDQESTLIITIPPQLDDVAMESERLSTWCRWINTNRRHYRKVIYISSTGVYPNQPGEWSEQSKFTPDATKGQLRILSEKIFAEYFETIVVRPGAIYGEKRNIGVRILAGKPVPKGDQPVHRIHVRDLARLCLELLNQGEAPKIINAVDLEPETTRNVAEWLLSQPYFPKEDVQKIEYRNQFQTRKFNLSQPDRKISNKLLVEEVGFQFQFPSYKVGLAHAFSH